MTEVQSKAAQRRYQREAEAICPFCDGKGRILSESVKTRARQGGHASYRKSLEPGQQSMQERGRKGGRPPALTLESLGLRDGDSKEEAKGAPNPTEAHAPNSLSQRGSTTRNEVT